MPLETANTIAELDQRWPRGGESASQGDDHLRMIKAVLKKQFPGKGGQGWDKPLTIDVDTLNNIFKLMKPVGTLEFRLDGINPGTLYGGTWKLIKADATITFGDGNAQTGLPVGDNLVEVPLPKHTHLAEFKGEQLDPHKHTLPYKTIGSGGGGTGPDVRGSSGLETDEVSAGTPKGEITIQDSGVEGDDAKINVRGARVAINVWEKVKD